MTKLPIIGLLGEAGSGKDTAAEILIKHHGYYGVALADPLKVYCGWLFGWQPWQMWADGKVKDAAIEDMTFSRCPHCGVPGPATERPTPAGPEPQCVACGYRGHMFSEWLGALSPRYALQSLGGWGRSIMPGVYAGLALKRAVAVLEGGHPICDEFRKFLPENVVEARYQNGNIGVRTAGIVISDVRYRNEMEAIQQAGGRVVRIVRHGKDNVIKTGIPGHHSETEQRSIADCEVNDFIFNDGTLEDLGNEVRRVVEGR
jgi:hypothetical protein